MSRPRGVTDGGPGWVPLTVRRSRIVTWLWLRTSPRSWLNYDIARWLARYLP